MIWPSLGAVLLFVQFRPEICRSRFCRRGWFWLCVRGMTLLHRFEKGKTAHRATAVFFFVLLNLLSYGFVGSTAVVQAQVAGSVTSGKGPEEGSAAQSAPQKALAPGTTQPEPKKKKSKILSGLVAAPLPISSPAIGSGLVPVVGYIFPISGKDKVSPPSVVGATGLMTNNGSRGFAVGGRINFKEDRYSASSAFVRGNLNYDIYGSGAAANLKLPLKQTGEAFFGEFLRRIKWKIFVGPRLQIGNSFVTVRPNTVSGFPLPPDLGLHTQLTAIGIRLIKDTRSSQFYPISGFYLSSTTDFFSQTLGSKYSFQAYRSVFDKFWRVGKGQVVAYEAAFCGTSGDPPFYGNCIYGTSNQLRGYTAGRYFTQYAFSTQSEYRLELPKRFGLVVFGGLGGVRPGSSQLFQRLQNSHFLPSGGIGPRFMLSSKYHVNLRADVGWGRDGHTFGMGVGEAF